MLNPLIFLIFLLIYWLPPFLKQGRKEMPSRKWYLFIALSIAIPGFIIVLGGQALFNWICVKLSIQKGTFLFSFLDAFIMAAVIEELAKFGAARLFIDRTGAKRKIDYIFLFAASGIGFEIVESFLQIVSQSSILAGIVRGAFCTHVFWQAYMGAHYYEYRTAKAAGNTCLAKKELCKVFLIPILLHGLNDLGPFMVPYENMQTAGVILVVVSLAAQITFIVLTLKMVYREAKKSADAERIPECAEPQS